MFPFDIDDEEIEISVEEEKEPADYEIDFRTGKLTGRIITGLDAIKQWAVLTLSTERYYYPQYSWEHGSEFETLIGRNYDSAYIKSECRRMLEDALLGYEGILGIEDVDCEIKGDRLTVRFILNTIYGRSEINV